jgi:hypothetical protein
MEGRTKAPHGNTNSYQSVQCDAEGAEAYYGRRIENDRTWTLYNVFNGIPATIDGVTLVGLSRTVCLDRMLEMNKAIRTSLDGKSFPATLSTSWIERQRLAVRSFFVPSAN